MVEKIETKGDWRDKAYDEAVELAAARFMAGEQPMSVSDGHAWNPFRTATYCNTKAKKSVRITSHVVTCPMCRAAIEHLAENYRKAHAE